MTRNTLIALAAMLTGALALAVAPKKPQPVTTAVIVAVTGFHCQACPDGLVPDLAKLPGVTKVQATLAPAQVTAVLDETQTPVSALLAAIAKHPQAMDAKKTYGTALRVYIDAPMCAKDAKMCPACFTEIPKMLKPVAGIKTVTLDSTGKVATLTFTPGAKVTTAQLTAALKKSSFHFTVGYAHPVKAVATTATCPMNGGGCKGCGM